jgi:protein-S-isoprenylcysteine O-methyltransferase Ste14
MRKKSKKKERELSQTPNNPYFQYQENEGFPRQLFVYASNIQMVLVSWNLFNHWKEYLYEHPARTLLGFSIFTYGTIKTKEMQEELGTYVKKNEHHNFDIGSLKTDGVYNSVRNPIYLGFMIGDIGLTLTAPSLETVIAGAVAIGCKIITVHEEEKRLNAQFGDEYRAYQETTPRWIPKASYFQDKMREYGIKHPTLTHLINTLGGI